LITAQRQQSSATAMVEAAQKQVLVSNSVVSQKQADLDYANLQFSYSIIIAPADGFASKKNIQVGQLVNAGASMFAIVSGNDVYVVANFKETQLGKMQKVIQ
jgi:membrane fusion protein, multidrug efflux system